MLKYPADYDNFYENLPYDYEYEKEWLNHYDIDKIYVIGVIQVLGVKVLINNVVIRNVLI